jgi:hypothetical protein
MLHRNEFSIEEVNFRGLIHVAGDIGGQEDKNQNRQGGDEQQEAKPSDKGKGAAGMLENSRRQLPLASTAL